jgi:outer membrane protein assembly factor BamE (lipoprotein component of BamABCDE complex)
LQSYQNKNYSKEDVINIIGMPLITEDSQNLWIYRMEKQQGNATFKKTIYNKTLKLRFEDNVLRSVEEVNLN